MSDDLARVRYFARQFLRTQDFTDEQAYHLALHRRHNIGQHGWGIVAGLDLTAEAGDLRVEPGAAVDGYGRDVVLPDRVPVPPSAFAENDTNVLAVSLSYDRVAAEPAPEGYTGCGDSETVPFYRWIERPRLVLQRFDPDADPRRPDTVPLADAGFGPSRKPPDDPDDDWPVFLGTVTRDPAKPLQPYVIDSAGRPYAGLVGQEIVAPSGRARVRLDAEDDLDPHRFAVYVAAGDPPVLAVAKPVAPATEETLQIRGPTTVTGDLTLPGHALEFQAAADRPGADPMCGIYHVADPMAGTSELRIEMSKASAPGRHQVVVGSWDADAEAFVPALTIDATGDVTVHGDLVVEGVLARRDVISTELPAAVKDLAMAGFLSGVGGASALLDRFYRSPADGPPGPMLRAAASLAAADDDRLADLARMLAEDPAVAARMRAALAPPPAGPIT